MQFEYRNCDPDADGVNQKTCHCAEGNFLIGRKDIAQFDEQWQKDIAQQV